MKLDFGETVNVTPLAKACLILVMILVVLMILDQFQTLIHHYRINKLEIKRKKEENDRRKIK